MNRNRSASAVSIALSLASHAAALAIGAAVIGARQEPAASSFAQPRPVSVALIAPRVVSAAPAPGNPAPTALPPAVPAPDPAEAVPGSIARIGADTAGPVETAQAGTIAMADNQDEHRADDAWDDTLLPPAPDEDDSESRSDDVTAMEKAGAEFKERLAETLAYPEAARRLGKSGSVGLVVLLEASGRVAGARVAASSGSAILDKAAREAALAVAEVSAPGVALELSLRAVFAAGAASLGP